MFDSVFKKMKAKANISVTKINIFKKKPHKEHT